jgi:AcrR family transcriptional regulator
VPTQARSKKRLEAILDAAAHAFATSGFDAVAMEAVAEAADTSIGSVYAFFPNKLALFEAIAARTREQSNAAFDDVVTAAASGRSWAEIVDLAVDAFARLQSDPTFRAIWMNMHLYSVFAKADADLHRSFVDRTEVLLAAHAPRLRAPKRRLVATMVVHALSGLLSVAARSKGERGAEIVAETKVMLRRYLEPYAPAG